LGDSRLFTIGIGSAPNSHFMRKAAEFGRGTFTYIGNTTEVQQKMEALFRKVELPALTDIAIDFPPEAHAEMFPAQISDVYRGEPIFVTIKADTLPDRVVVHGRIGQTPWKTSLALSSGHRREGLSIFWARAKIESFMDDQMNGTALETTRRTVINVALRHHLVSRYTSLVAVDVTPHGPADKDLNTHAVKTNLPYGQDYEHIFGLPQTATSGQVNILGGLLCLMLAVILFGLRLYRYEA
jgi:Ca-activated chloride channel family protein